ncbi:DUF3429 domain-containing protein [Stappia sp. F7233]|uniref:DUF3429 domain-containing protein n=1 Tax=Stappia albiluteola TaxID=2758565 RepID=A0A839AJS4_9HYPH|nr:DUF3429 domain-containing protein [Stappia albiluteola]MBA5779152.1 DUF3429 domain-containing protein [Stappia albiluteola]
MWTASTNRQEATASDVPLVARLLAYAAAVPFLAAPLMIYLEEAEDGPSTRGAIVYAALILSFLAGIRWGQGLFSQVDKDRRDRLFFWSIVPPLIGWDAVFLPETVGFFVLALAIGVQGAIDFTESGKGGLPAWFGKIRLHMTAIAMTGLISAGLVSA